MEEDGAEEVKPQGGTSPGLYAVWCGWKLSGFMICRPEIYANCECAVKLYLEEEECVHVFQEC